MKLKAHCRHGADDSNDVCFLYSSHRLLVVEPQQSKMHKSHVQKRGILLETVPLQHMEERTVLNVQTRTGVHLKVCLFVLG